MLRHDLPVVVIGAGGHARVLLSLLAVQKRHVEAVLDDNETLHGLSVGSESETVKGGLNSLAQHPADQVELVNAIGSAQRPVMRQAVFDRFSNMGYQFTSLVHPNAMIAKDAIIEKGAQVMAGAVVQTGALIKTNTLINTSASIDHDAKIGEHTHVAPGATICGGVNIGPGCHIGAGATIIQGITIEPGAVVGAGAAVLKDVKSYDVVAGVPATRLR